MTASKRRWFHYGQPWGLLQKTNPTATLKSAAIHAAVYGMLGAAAWLAIKYWRFPGTPLWTVTLGALAGGFLGGLIEWQINDTEDESPPPPAAG